MPLEKSDGPQVVEKRFGKDAAMRANATAKPGAAKIIRIVLVEDEKILADTLGAWLATDSNFKIEGKVDNPQAGFELCMEKRPDLALLDVEMPGGNGLTLARQLRERLPNLAIIILTGRVDPHTAWRAAQTGARGLVDKATGLGELHEAIHAIMAGGDYVSATFRRIREQQQAESEAFYKVLSNRELAVLYMVTDGASDEEIGRQLNISSETVACHRKNIRKKLDLHDDRSLIAYGRKCGTFGGEPPV